MPAHAVPAGAWRQFEATKWWVRGVHEEDDHRRCIRRLEANLGNRFPLARVVNPGRACVKELDSKLNNPHGDSGTDANRVPGTGSGKKPVRRSTKRILRVLPRVVRPQIELVVVHPVKKPLDTSHTT